MSLNQLFLNETKPLTFVPVVESLIMNERAAPTGVSGQTQLYQDSTSHTLRAKVNGNTAVDISTQTTSGVQTVAQEVITNTTNQIVLGTTNTTTINSVAPSASRVLSIQDPGASCNILTGLKQVITAVENAATTLTVADSGCIVFCPQSTHNNSGTVNVINLPAPTAGFNCKVVFTAVGDNTSAHGWQITSTGANLKGSSQGVAAGLVGVYYAAAADTSLIRNGVAADALIGDWVEIESDGTSTYFRAYSTGTANPYTVA